MDSISCGKTKMSEKLKSKSEEDKKIDSNEGQKVFCSWAELTWTITDTSLARKIKNADESKIFYSPIFTMFGMRWQIQFVPRSEADTVRIFLCLKTMRPNIKSIKLNRTYSMCGVQRAFENALITKDKKYTDSWSGSTGQKVRQKLVDSNELEIKIAVDLLAVLDKNDEDITSKYVEKDETKSISHGLESMSVEQTPRPIICNEDGLAASCTWPITGSSLIQQMRAADLDERFYGPIFTMFNMRWRIRIYPLRMSSEKRVCRIYLYLKSMPPSIQQVDVDVRYSFCGVEYQVDASITEDNMYANSMGSTIACKARKNMLQCDDLSIKLDVELLAVYDQEDEEITSEWVNKKTPF